MKTWLRWILVISQVGGGFTGFALTLDYLWSGGDEQAANILCILPMVLVLFAFITVAGTRFAFDERHTGMLQLALLPQLVSFSSPLLLWNLTSGFSLVLSLGEDGAGFNFWLGSVWGLQIFYDENPWSVGLNLFPALMLFLLWRASRQTRPQQAAMAGLDSMLAANPPSQGPEPGGTSAAS